MHWNHTGSLYVGASVTEQTVGPPGAARAQHSTPRIAVEKYWLFCYEWCHPGQREANAQSPNSPMACRLQITQGKVARKAPWVKEFGVLLGADRLEV